MTVSINQINTASDTFQNWVDRTNDVISVISNSAITANLSPVYATTVGNSFLYGEFGATYLCAEGGIRGGNSTSANTLVLIGNTYFAGDMVSFGDNIQILPGNATSYAAIVAYGVPYALTSSVLYANTNGSGSVLVDIYANSQWSASEYSVYMKDKTPGGNAVAFTKFIVTTDDYDTYITEYATMVTNTYAGSNGMLGTFSTTLAILGSTAVINLYFTPHSSVANCRLSITRNGVVGLFPE